MRLGMSAARVAASLGLVVVVVFSGGHAGADTVASIDTDGHGINSGVARDDHAPGHAGGGPVCRYEPVAVPPSNPMWYADRHHIPVDDGTGSWFIKTCGSLFGGVVYISRTNPADLLAAARQRLVLPAPVVRLSPTPLAVVHVPTWMWIDPASSTTESSTVAVPGVSVTVRAWPVASVWTMGDGTTVRCAGLGVPFDPHRDLAREPSCSHTYARSSAAAPDGRFIASVTVEWRASGTVTGAAGSGALPALFRTGQFSVRVAQVQALNRAEAVR